MKSASNALRLTLKLAISLVLVAWILHGIFAGEAEQQTKDWASLTFAEQVRASWTIGPVGLWETISGVSIVWLLASFVFMGATIFIGVIRWRLVLAVQGLHLSLGRATGISLVAHFFNSFLLGSTGGDLLKAYFAAAETESQKSRGRDHRRRRPVAWPVRDAALCFADGLGQLERRDEPATLHGGDARRPRHALRERLGRRAVILGRANWQARLKFEALLAKLPKGDVLVRCIEACHAFGEKPGFLPRVLGWSMLLSLACVLQIVALGFGLGLPMGEHFRVLLLIVPAIICISALPITPSGIGVRENLYVLLLSATAIGIEAKTALSLSLLAFTGSLLWSLIGGAVYLAFRSRRSLD